MHSISISLICFWKINLHDDDFNQIHFIYKTYIRVQCDSFEMIYVILFDWLPSKKQPNKVIIKGIKKSEFKEPNHNSSCSGELCVVSIKDVPINFHLMQMKNQMCTQKKLFKIVKQSKWPCLSCLIILSFHVVTLKTSY